MPWIWWCLERCWDCNCAGLSSTWTQCGVQRLSHDQENGRDMTWPISPLDQIFYEHGVKMGTLTATKKGPVAASDVSGQDFGRWLTTWSHQAKPPQSLLGARTKSSRYWFVVPVVSFCCTLLNLQPPWPASTETLIQTYLIWTVTSMNFNVSLIWKLGEHLCGSLNLLNRCVYWLSLAFAYFFALPSSGLWFRSSFPKGRFFCTTRNCAA